MVGPSQAVLDLGAGDGALARPLAPRTGRVDAVEISAAMAAAGRGRPGGDRANLRRRVESAETTGAEDPFALATAGASLHWMDWHTVLPWDGALREVIVRHSRNPDDDPGFSLPDELERLGLFEVRGRRETSPVTVHQPVGEDVEQFHSTASLARALMPPVEGARFRAEVAEIVRPYRDRGGRLRLRTAATLVRGRPGPPEVDGACVSRCSSPGSTAPDRCRRRGRRAWRRWPGGCLRR